MASSEDTGASYRSAWGKEQVVSEAERNKRNENAPDIADAYYDLINDHYVSVGARSSTTVDSNPVKHGKQLKLGHEHYLAFMAGIKPGMKVLDTGCGLGAPAREIAIFTGAHVTGITINKMQIAWGTQLSEEVNLQDQVQLVNGNFMKMPFEDNYFDVVYAFEALCHAPDLAGIYTEIHRVLKPGGTLAFYEEIKTPLYDEKNALHRKIFHQIERGAGVSSYVDAATVISTLKKTGWEVVYEEDRALAKANPVPWWYPLDGDMRYPSRFQDKFRTFFMKKGPFAFSCAIWKILHALHLTHPGRMEALKTVSDCVYGMRDGGKEGIFTPLHIFVAKKI